MKKIFEEQEVSSGNATGQGGGASLPFNKGFYQSGNSGEPGITFTPSSEYKIKSYKNMKHSKDKLKKDKKMKKFKEFVKEDLDIDNFTARYYDDYDDEEPAANEDDLHEFSPKNRKIQMYENLYDKKTFEMSGSPKPSFWTKADFVEFMERHGYHHTTLNKNTHMLVVAEEDLGTLKCQKAEKYGIPVYTYAYVKKEIKNLETAVTKYNF